MTEELRNELLYILKLYQTKEDQDLYIDLLLERFELGIKKELEDIERKQQKLQNNLELIAYIKNKIGIKED